MSFLWRDIRFGVRTLAKRPAFTVAAALTLALGIGANTAIFSVVYNLMYRSLPVPTAERLVSLLGRSPETRFHHTISYADYRDYRKLDQVFEDAIAFTSDLYQISHQGVPERVLATVTSGNYFSTLQLRPHLGRFYEEKEGDLGGQPVAVLSHHYWLSRFGGDSSIVGGSITINDRVVTVAGVTPESFPGTVGFVRAQVYVPLSVTEMTRPNFRKLIEDRSNLGWSVVARLRDGVTMGQAQAAVSAMSANLAKDHPETNKDLRVFVYPEPQTRLEAAAVDYMPLVAGVFMGMVGLVLLIACANVANLLLARAAGRAKEVAVRTALGAGRLRIARQLVTESILLSLLGGVGGLAIAVWATRLLAAIQVASDIPLHFDFSVNYTVFAFAAAITLGVGLLAGLAPALFASRANLAETLKESGRLELGTSRQPLRSLLVGAQIAVSVVLLICTGLFVQSMLNVSSTDPGFSLDNRFMVSIDTNLRNYDETRGKLFFRDLLDGVRDLPGVRSAATAWSVPVGFNSHGARVHLEGEGERSKADDRSRMILYNVVSEDYFETMGVRILQGRPLTNADTEKTRKTAVVNARMAELLWPTLDPIGQRFGLEGPEGPFMEVVGVAANGYYSVPGESPQPHFYVPFSQHYRSDQMLFVHSSTQLEAMLPQIRAQIRKLDSDMPIFDVRTLRTHFEEGKAAVLFRLPAALVGAFAVIGAFLAAVGLYGVIAYSVVQRTHEIGIRVALGATTGSIVRLISGKGLRLAGVGILAGLMLAYAATRLLANLLVGVSSSDPVTYAAMSAVVLAAAFAASFIPARFRAARIDPAISLRGE